MLRIILSVTGVLFIGLGLFWGNLQGKFGVDESSQSESQAKLMADEVMAQDTSAVVQSTAEESALAVDGATVASGDVIASAPVAAGSVIAEAGTKVTALTNEPIVAAVTPAKEMMKDAEEPALALAEVASSTVGAVDSATDDGAVPVAPAQKAGDLIAMAEQAKSSSRNAQIGVAKTILASSAQPLDEATAVTGDKEAELELAQTTTIGSIDNNIVLSVVKDRVNLRDGPSIEHPIVLTLDQGQELMEFKREGKWIHVGAYGTSGKIGWVHERLVGPVAR